MKVIGINDIKGMVFKQKSIEQLTEGFDLNFSLEEQQYFKDMLFSYMEAEHNIQVEKSMEDFDVYLALSSQDALLGRISFAVENKMILLLATGDNSIHDIENMKELFMVVKSFYTVYKQFSKGLIG